MNKATDRPDLLITNTDSAGLVVAVHTSATSSLPQRLCEGKAMSKVATGGCLIPSRVEKGLEMAQSRLVSQSHLPPFLNPALKISENCISGENRGGRQE